MTGRNMRQRGLFCREKTIQKRKKVCHAGGIHRLTVTPTGTTCSQTNGRQKWIIRKTGGIIETEKAYRVEGLILLIVLILLSLVATGDSFWTILSDRQK